MERMCHSPHQAMDYLCKTGNVTMDELYAKGWQGQCPSSQHDFPGVRSWLWLWWQMMWGQMRSIMSKSHPTSTVSTLLGWEAADGSEPLFHGHLNAAILLIQCTLGFGRLDTDCLGAGTSSHSAAISKTIITKLIESLRLGTAILKIYVKIDLRR